MSKESEIDICKTCRFGVQNYVSIIGTIPWCCQKHWHCKPGRLASDYMQKDEVGNEEEQYEPKTKPQDAKSVGGMEQNGQGSAETA